MKSVRAWILLLCCLTAIGGCVTFNEVLVGVNKEDPNRVRDAARKRVMFDGELEIDSSNICGSRALHLAISKQRDDIVLILLQEGANPNLKSEIPREPGMCADLGYDGPPPGQPPLHYAILRNRPEAAEAILFHGADPGLADAQGKTALELARGRQGMERVVAYLESPPHLAARTGDIETLRRAVADGADLNGRLELTGTTPVEEALLQRQWFIVDYLLENGGGVQSSLVSEDVRTAIAEYTDERPESPHVTALSEIAGLPVSE